MTTYIYNNKKTADPNISSNGQIQAERLKDYLVPHLTNQASQPIQIITSPMNRTIQTILPTLHQLKGDKLDVLVNGLYFESEGCHLKGVPQQGMNQHQIRDILASNNSQIHNPTFVGFDENPNLGWYHYGEGPETRSESEERATAFYTWLCEYLDVQLMECQQSLTNPKRDENDRDAALDEKDEKDDSKSHGIYDAGVSLPEEQHEFDHDKLSTRKRKRRTAICIGHGDFMSLCLKRIVSGFGHYVENFGVPHRTAFTHFNTGITELEYFGKGTFLSKLFQ